ncbi:MAG: hypothetical protein HZB71_04800 [Betaproteobacteria bacterium]|nr:hypothetical protein [Betaproteobacteria bacterium]
MRLLCAISHHGLGHLAQAAPILNALHARRPEIEWVIWSGLAREALARRVHAPFVHRREAADEGLVMRDAIRVNVPASLDALRAFHAGWSDRVGREAAWLAQERIDAVLSDVAYLPLAAARRAGVAAVAFSSLNWFDIAAAYLGPEPGVDALLDEVREAYQTAPFLRLTPAMPMSWLRESECLPPVAMTGCDRRTELLARLSLDANVCLAVIGFGGIGYAGRGELPAIAGVVWLAPPDWRGRGERPDLFGFDQTGLEFIDLLASCDVLITKTGYGSYVEAAANGVAVLHVERPDWPETPFLSAWLETAARALSVREEELFSPTLAARLEALRALPARTPVRADGAEAAASRILELFQP